MKKYGYIRVSSKDQNIDRQVESLRQLKIEDKNMFVDKQSGKNFERKNYQRMVKNCWREMKFTLNQLIGLEEITMKLWSNGDI